MNVLERLSECKYVSSHSDADGVTSTVLLSYYIDDMEVEYPTVFGNISSNTHVCLDMIPIDSEFTGICIDHHPNHPSNRKYHLIWKNYPTSLIVYELLREYIPSTHRWKVVVGLVGDGQAELIPVEIWKSFPILLEEYCYPKFSYGDISFRGYRVYKLLSSGINSLCRLNHPESATLLLKHANSPLDLLRDNAILNAKQIVEKEIRRVVEEGLMMKLDKILYFEFSSEYRIESLVASYLSRNMDTGVIVYNTKTCKGSIRGVLSTYIQDLLRGDLDIGGHPGYMGFNTESRVDILSILRRRLGER